MRKITGIVIAIVALMAGPAFAFTMDVNDGGLTEWGVDISHGDWIPDMTEYYTLEDQTSYYLYPGYGGQDFDAEAMYITYDSQNLYFAIVTGFPPTGKSGYVPGDVAFDFGNGYTYGLEVNGNRGFTQGALYNVATWGKGYNNWGGGAYFGGAYVGAPTEILTVNGNPLGMGGLNYYQYASQRYIIEGYVPHAYFGTDWYEGATFRTHWTMTCGNDFIEVDSTVTPEPASMALLGMGLVGVFGMKKRYLVPRT